MSRTSCTTHAGGADGHDFSHGRGLQALHLAVGLAQIAQELLTLLQLCQHIMPRKLVSRSELIWMTAPMHTQTCLR